MKLCIELKEIARCLSCNGLVKPDIVFFGESVCLCFLSGLFGSLTSLTYGLQLPPRFIQSIPAMRQADLVIVLGTSLTVHPFASLAGRVDESCPRVLINIERVGDFGHRKRDVVLLGKCDEIIKELCAKLGWEEELEKAWAETAEGAIVERTNEEQKSKEQSGDEDEKDLKEVGFLTAAIEARLDLQEKMKGEKEKEINVTERERVPANHGPILDVPSEPSRPTAELLETEKEKETSISTSKSSNAEENGGVDSIGGKL